MVEICERGLAVTIIDMGQQLLNPLDPEMAKLVEQHMRLNGVEVRLEEGVTAFEEQGAQLRLTSGVCFRRTWLFWRSVLFLKMSW